MPVFDQEKVFAFREDLDQVMVIFRAFRLGGTPELTNLKDDAALTPRLLALTMSAIPDCLPRFVV
jgi:hypothetical protein